MRFTFLHLFIAAAFAVVLTGSIARAAKGVEPSSESTKAIGSFVRAHCLDCHQGPKAEGGLDLAKLGHNLSDVDVQKHWVRIFDRVRDGEMPPPDSGTLPKKDVAAFLEATGQWLRTFQYNEEQRVGRVKARRLSRREIERSLHDLLAIDIPLADQLPEESRSAGFTTVADGQSMSHFQLERHLAVVDVALDEAFRRAFSTDDAYDHTFDARQVARKKAYVRTREPELLDGRAVTWSGGPTFYGRLPITTAPVDGWYHFKVRASGLKLPDTGGVWTTIRGGPGVSSAPLLSWIGAVELAEKPRDFEFDAWLPKGHMLEIHPGDVTLKKARFDGGQVGAGEGGPQDVPGIAIDRISMKRIHRNDNDLVRQRLLAGAAVKPAKKEGHLQLASKMSEADAVKLVERFARRAFRYPATPKELEPYAAMVRQSLAEGHEPPVALRAGYRAVLCSPRFLYLKESPGKLNDYAIAARLSYFLTGSTPDDHLEKLATAGRLHDNSTIRAEVDRLLAGEKGRRFIQDFAAEWLELDLIDFTEPDRKLFPNFDPIVQYSMLDETHTYLETMLRDDMSVTNLIDSDFTFLNSRLARFYGIDGVSGDKLSRIALDPASHRGGVLTQGAVLKVTANGSNTSPVVRGVWVSERLLGQAIPPPPSGIPAIEPDIRGAQTIREILVKHRSQDSCASCHTKIDPAGFALENFDPAGQWRDKYLQLVKGKPHRGATIDASYTLPDGRKFGDVDEFRDLIVARPRRLARCVAEKLMVYGTGAPISFADRQAIEAIVEQAAKDDYGLRSLVKLVATSPVFLSK